MAAELFGDDDAADTDDRERPEFAAITAMQGLDAVAAVEDCARSGERHSRSRSSTYACRRVSTARKPPRVFARSIPTSTSSSSPAFPISRRSTSAGRRARRQDLLHRQAVRGRRSASRPRPRSRIAGRIDRDLQQAMAIARGAKGSSSPPMNRSAHPHRQPRRADRRAQPARVSPSADRQGGARRACFAMAMVDLDRFKLVNDTLGHLAGDELIRMICAILQANVPEGGLVARLGGDEFGDACSYVTGEDGSSDGCASGCSRRVRSSFEVFGHSVQGGASVGLIVVERRQRRRSGRCDAPRRSRAQRGQAARAAACVRAVRREHGRDRSASAAGSKAGCAKRSRKGELSLVYQPIVAAATWRSSGSRRCCAGTPTNSARQPGDVHPDRRRIEPDPRVGRLGARSSAQGARRLARPICLGQFLAAPVPPPEFRRTCRSSASERAGIAPGRVQIEITETAIFDNAERAAETLYKLRQMGFRIALDDFGTGYSSLYNIRKFALDCLKIDKQLHRRHGPRARKRRDRPFDRSISAARWGWESSPRVSRPKPRSRRCASPAQPHAGLLFLAPGDCRGCAGASPNARIMAARTISTATNSRSAGNGTDG